MTTTSDKVFRIVAVLVAVALLAGLGWAIYAKVNVADRARTPIAYSEFMAALDQDQVRQVLIKGHDIVLKKVDGRYFTTVAPDDPDLVKILRGKNVAIMAETPPDTHGAAATWLPVIVLVLLAGASLWYIRRSSRGAQANPMAKSKARLLVQAEGSVTFADVAGVDEARDSLQEIVDYLRDPSRFQRLGGRIPSGVLLVGPPGTGKTLLARAIAGEAGVPFFTLSGSDFVEMFVGVGAARVRDLFEQAKKSAPCIVFMDEIDAVGRKRGAGVGQGNDEREQTLNQLLVEMDGFHSGDGVILIAATNRPDVLDPALLRPGRFDREVVVSKPDVLGREQILAVHAAKTPLAADVDLKTIARRTPGFAGADLMNLVNEAALLAARRQRSDVSMREFEDAKDTVTMGAERRSFILTEEERKLTAYREGGRVVVALHAPAADPIHKATIIPRGRSVGTVNQVAADDQQAQTLEQMRSKLAILLAGRVAEEMVFGRDKITSATAGDIDEASRLARAMVGRYGLSDKLGVMAYEENEDEVFLGASIGRQKHVSETTAQLITDEARSLLDAAAAQAKAVLTRHKGELEAVAQGLLLYESLSGDDITGLLAGKKPGRETAAKRPGVSAP